ncbi:MAG: transposase [Gammaproteobacteria bacterium]|nr:transposase [Gammaproteobacteria bacterium]
MKCPLEIQMDTSALTTTTSSARPGGVRCMRTNAEKVAIVEEAQQPGRSVAEVARKYGVNANLIFGWTRLHKRGLLVQCREPAKLLPVKIRQPRRPRASTPDISLVPTAPPTEALEIIFPNGTRLRVPAAMVASVLLTLGALLSR